ncbi:hypothetical protein EJ110_NYTH33074 [Nymphaea thermarum]|nr:hypothetical protein EJ110_NYTH33074 [Nymphaea thermarum]
MDIEEFDIEGEPELNALNMNVDESALPSFTHMDYNGENGEDSFLLLVSLSMGRKACAVCKAVEQCLLQTVSLVACFKTIY